jgi:SAM-dependent methyltransferase
MVKKKTQKSKKVVVKPVEDLKIDIGCGPNKQPGFKGIDIRKFDGVDFQFDVGKDTWPFKDDSVDEAYCSHLMEHLKPAARIHCVNELHRVLKPGAKCTLITPHWASNRAYGDLTHEWPPVSEMWFYYLNKDWRTAQAPHNDEYTCNFEVTWGYLLKPEIQARNQEYQIYALQNYKESALDMIATMVKPHVKREE